LPLPLPVHRAPPVSGRLQGVGRRHRPVRFPSLTVSLGVGDEENVHVWRHLAATRGGGGPSVEYHFRRPVRFGGSMARSKLAVLLLVAALTAAACGSRASRAQKLEALRGAGSGGSIEAGGTGGGLDTGAAAGTTGGATGGA